MKWSRKDDLEIDFRLTGFGRAYGAPNHFIGTRTTDFTETRETGVLPMCRALRDSGDRRGQRKPVGKGLGVLRWTMTGTAGSI